MLKSLKLYVYAAAVAFTLMAIASAYYYGRNSANREWKLKWVEAENASAARSLVIERAMQTEVNDVRSKLNGALNAIERKDQALSSLRSDVSGLRKQLSYFAMPENSGATCGEKLSAIAAQTARGGELLDEGQELVQRFAKDHDRAVEEMNALLNAWPTNELKGE